MSRRNGNAPKLDLRLNLSPPRVINHHHHHIDHQQHPISPNRSMTTSPTSSCVSSEDSPARRHHDTTTNSPETPTTSMVLVGCPRCLMYVMLAEADPRCPKCKSTCLLDVIYESNNTSTTRRRIT